MVFQRHYQPRPFDTSSSGITRSRNPGSETRYQRSLCFRCRVVNRHPRVHHGGEWGLNLILSVEGTCTSSLSNPIYVCHLLSSLPTPKDEDTTNTFLAAQLVKYMRINMLKFGAPSTYKTTVFVKRTDAYRWVSLPVDEGASSPTVRECLLAMATFASEDSEFVDLEGFNEAQVICNPKKIYCGLI